MNLAELARRRMHVQRLIGERFSHPVDMVRWHLAVQSQDYPGALWGIGQRCDDITASVLDELFDRGAILRTHVLRPTWHFVLPEDIRWLLDLTGPRVQRSTAGRYRQLELDDATLTRSADIITGALEGNTWLTRPELGERLEAVGISTKGQRLAHIVMYSELEGLICSGPRRGKQFTYALMDERAPSSRGVERDEAIAELTRRYLASHGPATPHDLAWWSGLTVTDARRGIAMIRDDIESITIDDTTWWHIPGRAGPTSPDPLVRLLPNFDEYYVGFRNNEVAWDPAIRNRYDTGREFWMNHYVTLNGSIVGGWTRKLGSDAVEISTNFPAGLSDAAWTQLYEQARAYGTFLDVSHVQVDGAIVT